MLAVHLWTSCRQQTGPSQPQLFSLCPLSWQDSLLPVPGPTLHSSPWPFNGWHSVVYISRLFFGLPFSWYRLAWPSPAGPPGRAQPCTLPSRLSPPQSTLYCQQASPHVWPTGHQASSPHSWGPLSPRVGLTLYCLQDPHGGGLTRTRRSSPSPFALVALSPCLNPRDNWAARSQLTPRQELDACLLRYWTLLLYDVPDTSPGAHSMARTLLVTGRIS